MKRLLVVFLALLFGTAQLEAQLMRRSQFEVYTGLAKPMAPDEFKDFMQVGLSGNVQYVLFPSPKLGITVNVGYQGFFSDNAAFTNYLSEMATGYTADEWVDAGFNVNGVPIDPEAEIKATAIQFGGGIRPYLSNPSSNMQFFLLAQVNYNLLNYDFSATQLPYYYDAGTGELWMDTFTDEEWEEAFEDNDENVLGYGFGAGFEMPAGETLNLVVQAFYQILNTSDESTSFLTFTVGLVF